MWRYSTYSGFFALIKQKIKQFADNESYQCAKTCKNNSYAHFPTFLLFAYNLTFAVFGYLDIYKRLAMTVGEKIVDTILFFKRR